MPKIIDYGGRFAFFELASFTLVRDHGVDRLSRHGLAKVLGTSISTVRRLLNPEADLRHLALNEVGVRRRARLGRRGGAGGGGGRSRTDVPGVDAAMALLAPVLPTCAADVAAELVWWRLVIAAPSTAVVPRGPEDEDQDVDEDEDDDGPLHHRFAVANHGYVPSDVLRLRVDPPRAAVDEDGEMDPVVEARQERHAEVADRVVAAVRAVDPDVGRDDAQRSAELLHALVDGLGVQVCVGDLGVERAVGIVRGHLESLLVARAG